MVRPAKPMSSSPLPSPGNPGFDLQSNHSMVTATGVVQCALLDSVLTATWCPAVLGHLRHADWCAAMCIHEVCADRHPGVLQFAAMNKLKKAALMVMARNLSHEEISGLRQLFKSIDLDNSGTITVDELKVTVYLMHCLRVNFVFVALWI